MMKKCLVMVLIIGLFLVSACSLAGISPKDVQATEAAAAAATATADAKMNAIIETSVAATATALPTQTPYPTQTPSLTATPFPSRPTATPVDPTNLSEQEMADAISTSWDEANQSAYQTTTEVARASSDTTITLEEIKLLLYDMESTDAEIQEVLDLTGEFIQIYQDYGDSVLTLVAQLKDDLDALVKSTASLDVSLAQIKGAIQNGQQVTQAAIKELQTNTQTARSKAQEINTKYRGLSKLVKTEIDSRASAIQNLKPNQVAINRSTALSQTKDYVSQVKTGLADGKITNTELIKLSQAGVNAIAGLQKFNISGAQQLSASIASLNQQLARAQVPQAKTSIASLEKLVLKLS